MALKQLNGILRGTSSPPTQYKTECHSSNGFSVISFEDSGRMTKPFQRISVLLTFLGAVALQPSAHGDNSWNGLKRDFQTVVRPFLQTYCIGCHGMVKPRARFDLSPYTSMESVAGDLGHWKLVLERLGAKEMPPKKATKKPSPELRKQIVNWIERLRRHEAQRAAGDPGPVLARRLSNAEYNYAIQDLTGADIQPTRDFPIDPANKAGFDNSGESLTLSPALLSKYLSAAQHVADHLLLLPDRLAFADHKVAGTYDRDKFCAHRIVNFYKRQPTDYAEYFFAAWQFRHRSKLRMAQATLEEVARRNHVSPKYLSKIWTLLNDPKDHRGPIAELRRMWRGLPGPEKASPETIETARKDCEKLKALVWKLRKGLNLYVGNYKVPQLNKSAQPFILWKDRAIAANRRKGKLPRSDGKPVTEKLRRAISRFCSVFPDTFYVSERGRMFEKAGLDKALAPNKRSTGRLLSAGFHLMFGFFRDDGPLYDLVLNREQQQQLDQMWQDMEFVTEAAKRQFSDFIYFERAEYPAFLKEKEFDFAREDAELTSQEKIQRLAKLYLAKARSVGITEDGLKIIDAFFVETAANIRKLEKAQVEAEPSHLSGLVNLAERAWQRPLTTADRDELISFYKTSRKKLGLSHAQAVRDTLASILMSPRFFYRATVAKPGRKPQRLSDHELASRLSFFLWSSIPDRQLRELASDGKLQDSKVLLHQAQRMLKDPKAARLAIEFGGNWLDFRRFQSHNAVNRERFPQFTDKLRQSMFEEPVRFLADLIHRNGSVLELLNGNHTFVNGPLAKHYGMPFTGKNANQWQKVEDARRYGRGGLLPMAIFLTRNSPGLRTSPVKRGYWVVRRLLGEHIPAPPAEVPELPEDESKLGELSLREVLEKHRSVKSCGMCHRRFDSIGLVFEGYGPVGERRQKDLGGRPVDDSAELPNGTKGRGVDGLRRYLQQSRRDEFLDNLSRKLLSYGLGRSLLLSDEPILDLMKKRMATEKYSFHSLIEAIVTSPQFQHARGRDYKRGR